MQIVDYKGSDRIKGNKKILIIGGVAAGGRVGYWDHYVWQICIVYNDMSSNFLLTEQDIITSGDYYFYNFLNSKVKLTELGLYILDTLKGEKLKTNIPPGKPDTFQDYSSLENIRPN